MAKKSEKGSDVCYIVWILIAIVLLFGVVYFVLFPKPLPEFGEEVEVKAGYAGIVTPAGKNVTLFLNKPKAFYLWGSNYTIVLKDTGVNTSLLFMEAQEVVLISAINKAVGVDLTGEGKPDLSVKLLYVEPKLALVELKRLE